jgi:hypothetical protein
MAAWSVCWTVSFCAAVMCAPDAEGLADAAAVDDGVDLDDGAELPHPVKLTSSAAVVIASRNFTQRDSKVA